MWKLVKAGCDWLKPVEASRLVAYGQWLSSGPILFIIRKDITSTGSKFVPIEHIIKNKGRIPLYWGSSFFVPVVIFLQCQPAINPVF